jgi:DNA invertase Pin-like site-specific DNA recombinase
MNKPKPIAVYLRKSAKDQNMEGQREAVLQWLVGNGVDLDKVEWYEDVESGRKLSRKAFDRLQKDVFDGHVKQIVVYKVDRIARRMLEGLQIVCGWCEKGVRFVSTTQQIDVSGTIGRMVAAMLFGFAEIEWEYRKERQEAGIVVAKRNGVYKGRKPGTLKGKPERVRELSEKGLKPDEIAQATGLSRRTVYNYLAVA